MAWVDLLDIIGLILIELQAIRITCFRFQCFYYAKYTSTEASTFNEFETIIGTDMHKKYVTFHIYNCFLRSNHTLANNTKQLNMHISKSFVGS